jgi:hypothetical protein
MEAEPRTLVDILSGQRLWHQPMNHERTDTSPRPMLGSHTQRLQTACVGQARARTGVNR